MDSNNSRYRALVTRQDWTAPARSQHDALRWSDAAAALTLRPYQYEFQPPGSSPALPDEPGCGGVFDRHGNLYALAADRRGIRIRSAGSGQDSLFWPVGDSRQTGVAAVQGLRTGRPAAETRPDDGHFQPAAAPTPLPDLRLDALVVTSGHYLVAASADAGGLLVFDLHGAGPPLLQPWPGLGRVTALVALANGGIGAVLGQTLHRTDASLKPCVSVPTPAPIFTPEAAARVRGAAAAAAPPSAAAAPAGPAPQVDLSPALPPGSSVTALRVWPGGLLVLGRDPAQGGALVLGALDAADQPVSVVDADAPPGAPPAAGPGLALGPLVQNVSAAEGRAQPRPLAGHALALCRLPGQAALADGRHSLFVLAAAGDQAFRFELVPGAKGLAVQLHPEFWPMRRYDAGGLATLPDGATLHDYPAARVFHATAAGWAPLLRLDRPRYASDDSLLTPVWDGQADGCVWHRLMLDARLPSGTEVTVYSRTVDGARDRAEAEALIAQAAWQAEPPLATHPRGSELPWLAAGAADAGGFATRDLLLQAARGRWFQARLDIRGDGQRTPALRALRVWYPRFAYARAYLPPVYREDAASADFLDRLLALFEGEFTRWEDRIAAAQWLIDSRTAPADALDWLAGWVALAFDPADTDPARRRLLLRHAVTGYARRGTVPGLLLSATLAWEPVADEAWLRDPAQLTNRRDGLRLQEFFGRVGALPAAAWQPAQGREALLARLGGDAGLVVTGITDSVTDGATDPAADTATDTATDPAAEWPAADAGAGVAEGSTTTGAPPATERRTRLIAALGFVPRAAQQEAPLWSAWQQQAGANALPPDDEPASADARSAWAHYLQASAPCAALRQRWQDFLARRWRRISALNAAWGTRWTAFDRIATPLALPGAAAALADWHRFEAQVLRAQPAAHRFRIVLPLPDPLPDLDELARRRAAVWRAMQRDQPAHTVAELRFGFDLFRVGEARLGLDTLLHLGLARQPALASLGRRPILGRAELGQTRLEPTRPLPPVDRIGLDRGARHDTF